MAAVTPYDSDFEEQAARLDRRELNSDEESGDDLDSPTDGYFRERPSPPRQLFVQRPGVEESEAKRREAAEQSHAVPSASRQQAWPEEPLQILDAGPAPPDYAAATADRRELVSPTFSSDHPLVRNGIFEDQAPQEPIGVPHTTQDDRTTSRQPAVPPYVAPRDVEQAIDAERPIDERTGLLGRRRRKHDKKWTVRRCFTQLCRTLIRILVTFIVVIMIIAAVVRYIYNNTSDRIEYDGPTDITPPHPDLPHCKWRHYSETKAFDVRPTDAFVFIEKFNYADFADLLPSAQALTGRIHVSLLPEWDDDDYENPEVRVVVNVATTKELKVTNVSAFLHDPDRFRLQLLFPEVERLSEGQDWWDRPSDGSGRLPPCMDLSIAIYIKNNTHFSHWGIDTLNMDVGMQDDLFDAVGVPSGSMFGKTLSFYEAEIRTQRGNINVPYWSSTRALFSTLSGKITGSFALRDLLELSSSSGDITAHVKPKEAEKEHVVPARFLSKTISGNVDISFPSPKYDTYALPKRTYLTTVDTISGAIRGIYPLGYSSIFSSTAGNIDVTLHPASLKFGHGTALVTDNKAGKTYIRVEKPLSTTHFRNETWNLDGLESKHTSMSGRIHAQYPEVWAGVVDVETISGKTDLRGDELQIDVDEGALGLGNGYGYKHVIGHNGVGWSLMEFETVSGDVKMEIGYVEGSS